MVIVRASAVHIQNWNDTEKISMALRKDDTQIREAFHIFTFFPYPLCKQFCLTAKHAERQSHTLRHISHQITKTGITKNTFVLTC